MEQLDRLETEARNRNSAQIDRVATSALVAILNNEDLLVAQSVTNVIKDVAAAIDGVAAALQAGGRLFYIGAGTSGRLGVLDAAECPPTYGVSPELVQGILAGGDSAMVRATEATEDDPESGVRDLLARGFRSGDVLCGIAASGRTPYVLGAIRQANEMGALTLGISCVAGSKLSAAVRIAITPVTGPEVVTGSTRMKAGTATKMVLNMISTGVMIRLGMTYGNLMVNVQPKNEKLVDRARRIIAEATGVSVARAGELLEESGRSVRTAIVMEKLSIDREEANRRLAQNHNVVARTLGEV